MDRAEAVSDREMGRRRQEAANARAGLARLELAAAQQEADRAQRRLQDAQRRVADEDIGVLAAAVHHYLAARQDTLCPAPFSPTQKNRSPS